MSSSSCITPVCLTIGNFDGVHLGHRYLIDHARKIAASRQLEFALMTFWPHPRVIIKGPESHLPLASHSDKLNLLTQAGANLIIEEQFTGNLAAMSPKEFFQAYLVPQCVKELVIGHDFSLGHNRVGTPEALQKLGREFGINVTRAEVFTIGGEPVSSTRLRKAIQAGNMELARAMLGRPYSISGTVGHGYARGRVLGFPTANLSGIEVLLPPKGVYATKALYQGKPYPAVTNIGMNPTFGNDRLTVESFLLDANLNLYNEPLNLEFQRFLRPEEKFPNQDALVAQIEKDIATARTLFAANDLHSVPGHH